MIPHLQRYRHAGIPMYSQHTSALYMRHPEIAGNRRGMVIFLCLAVFVIGELCVMIAAVEARK